MPSVSKKQHNLMAAVAHSPAFAKKVGISQDVGKHFMSKDKGKKFAKGGGTAKKSSSTTKPSSYTPSSYIEDISNAKQQREALQDANAQSYREQGRAEGRKRNYVASGASIPSAYLTRAKQYIGDKIDDLDAYLSEKAGMEDRANRLGNYRAGAGTSKYKEGGDVKNEMKAAKVFAKAGEKKLAAHERREAAGKEKDTPAIAKKEEAVLKREKAPKDVQAYEKKEHKSMGMKKGGGVKKYAKQTKRGGSSARMMRPRVNPAALAALLGGAGPAAPAAPMGAPMGAPGMAHGGGVHHHHHYYAGGATVGKGKDGAAKRGRTKVKVR